ncbi:MAG: peptidylprolyl isomerase, partial [Clostridia bacterium]
FSMAGCGKLQISREIAKVNGRVVTKAEYLYYLENVKQQMLSESGTQDTEGFWDAEIDGEKASEAAKKKALEEMLRVEIACIKAEEKGLTVPSEDQKQIRAMVKSTDRNQKAQVDALQEATGLSDDQLINLLNKTSLANAFASDINANDPDSLTPTDEEIAAAYQQKYVHVKHILIGNTDESANGAADGVQAPASPDAEATEAPSEEDAAAAAEAYKAEQKAKAAEVLEKAKAGADFDALVKEYGEDPGMESSPDGYTFTKGSMVAEFEDAAFALGVGEISDLVETTYGWHIIKKYELPTAGDDYDKAVQSIKGELSQDKYNALIDSYKSDMTIEIRQGVVDGIKVK